MTRRRGLLSLILTAVLVAAALPLAAAENQGQAPLTELLKLLQDDDAAATDVAAALRRAEEFLGSPPPPCDPENPMFVDVPASNIFCPFIEELARRGITGGCAEDPPRFCPAAGVTRAEMATFIVKSQGEAAWHEVGSPGEPGFGHPESVECAWTNVDGTHRSAGFLRDGDGFVRLKGFVRVGDPFDFCGDVFDSILAERTIFILPPGLCPQRRSVFVALTNGQLGRVTVRSCGDDVAGSVHVDPPTTFLNAEQWVSLDGISFRAD